MLYVLMDSLADADGIGFGLQALQTIAHRNLALGNLFVNAVSCGGNLCPSGKSRHALSMFKLIAKCG